MHVTHYSNYITSHLHVTAHMHKLPRELIGLHERKSLGFGLQNGPSHVKCPSLLNLHSTHKHPISHLALSHISSRINKSGPSRYPIAQEKPPQITCTDCMHAHVISQVHVISKVQVCWLPQLFYFCGLGLEFWVDSHSRSENVARP